ncbi:MAG: DUF4838 domain-containing protein [Prosthecobacter sp.]|jgi:hypothetical protein|uniref:DUF4838 domain-containing protein n=1 Tax=Prosthecobacter sp. TaxID=1965333 RepID=UPI0019EA2069|nr:DUF4838 domain-containing protein [Prosthecobacter sp.]MBE2285107.1 DUF4838 domain-containing protein [Prosthecobacter sp.]
MPRLIFAFLLLSSFSWADVALVRDGRAQAVVVTPEKPTRVVSYAAQELMRHVEKACGVKLDVVTEGMAKSGPRIFIGPCHESGVEAEKLAPEACVLRVTDAAIFIAGNDDGGDPLDTDTRAGTLWGVYEWLERDLGVRWLWPGELGTFVAKRTTIIAKTADETIAPHFFRRHIRPGLGFESEHPALGFTKEAAKQFSDEQTVFLRRHRMGRSQSISYGHAFTDWWEEDGKTHPEWFQLLDGGKRGPKKKGGRFSLCVSNPDLAREVVARWSAKRPPDATTSGFINAVENDIPGLCTCENCLALDGPAPADHLTFYPPDSKVAGTRFVSDRYAHFWLDVQKQAPAGCTVIGYAYFNYFSAPTSGIRLNKNILVGFCPSAGWFPRSDAEHAWMKQQWTGWHETDARLFMRTNHLLDGYCMPFIFARQFADEFHHAVKHGMVATDYDSLTGHWATQGPNLYVAARLHTRPEASADELLAEYYAAFGPASTQVKNYFDQWEDYTTDSREKIAQTMQTTQTSRWRNWAKAAHVIYPPECFQQPETMLEAAAKAVADDAEAAARVKFLRLGLQHAKLCARVSAKLTLAGSTATKDEIKQVLEELLAFRRAYERSGISNFNHLAWVEDLSWKLSEETRQTPDLYP